MYSNSLHSSFLIRTKKDSNKVASIQLQKYFKRGIVYNHKKKLNSQKTIQLLKSFLLHTVERQNLYLIGIILSFVICTFRIPQEISTILTVFETSSCPMCIDLNYKACKKFKLS